MFLTSHRFTSTFLHFPEHVITQLHIKPRCFSSTCDEFVDLFNYFLHQSTTTQHCKQVHSQIIINGFSNSSFLAARIVSVYARFRPVFYARKVFDTTIVEDSSNLLLWNSIIRANVCHGYFKEALEVYGKMREFRILADGFTIPLIIKACAHIADSNLCKNVHSYVLQVGFQNNLHVGSELIGMYGKLGQMSNARKVFDKMPVRSHLSWNTVMSGYAYNNDSLGALEIFQKMEVEGLEPNPVTWTSFLSSHARSGLLEETVELFGNMMMKGISVTAEVLSVVLSVCAHLSAFDKGKMIHGYMVKGGYEEYFFAKNALISVYGKCGVVKDAEKLFAEMKIKNIVSWNALISTFAESGLCNEAFALFSQMEKSGIVRPNVVSWSAVISGFSSGSQGEVALELFRKMQLGTVIANYVTISNVLSVCAGFAALNLGREIHAHVIRALVNDNIMIGNSLINMYTRCGSFKQGQFIFNHIKFRDTISWNSMISGYGVHGLGQKALETFDEMIKSGFGPDGVTFIAVLSACSHTGLVSEGRRVFNQMIKDFRIEPQMEHYACLVDLLGRAGLLQEASEVVKSMPVQPNACVWGALLNSCRMHKYVDFAEEIGSKISSMEGDTGGSYMLLSNVFAASGRWKDSAVVRVSRRMRGEQKTPGQSWIEVKKKVYVFKAGSTIVHSGLETVYQIIDELVLHMESEGYAPDNIF